MARPKRLEMTALFGLVLQIVFFIAALLLAEHSQSRAVTAQAWFLCAGIFVWLVVLIHGRQRRLAMQERDERERLKQTRLSDEMFAQQELDTARATAGLLLFEKFIVPVVSVVFSGLLFFFVWKVGRDIWQQAWTVENPSVVAVGMVFMSFGGYLVGRYAAGLAQSEGYRLLRAAGGYMLGNVIGSVAIAADMALYCFDIKWAEPVVAYAIPVVMALVALETLLNLVLDVYRPRIEGQETRPPYDSRLLGLFAEPGGVVHTVAATLDYQFGFKVSETWFYHFMERTIVPLLLVQLVALWLLTTIVMVDPNEVVFLERLGKPLVTKADAARGMLATMYEPGFYIKAPWPFTVAQHVPAYKVHSLQVGKVYERTASKSLLMQKRVAASEDLVLWRELHIDPLKGYEVSFLVPSTGEILSEQQTAASGSQEAAAPGSEGTFYIAASTEMATAEAAKKAPKVNLARLEAEVYFRVKRKGGGAIDEAAAFNYAYRQYDVARQLERLAFAAICRTAASQDFLPWVAQDRESVVKRFETALAVAVESANMGVEVVDVSISSVHPPAEVAASFESVVAALENRQVQIQQGEQESVTTVKSSEARATELIRMSEGYREHVATVAKAEAEQFLTQLGAYKKAPLVYKYRTYFDVLEEALKGQKVYVVPVSQNEVQVIDLQEKLRSGLLEGMNIMEGQ